MNVSRQAVGKWENGTAYPDLERLIQLSDHFKISLDRLVKEAENCDLDVKNKENPDKRHLIKFLLRAKNMNCFLYLFKSSFVIYLVFINLIIQ